MRTGRLWPRGVVGQLVLVTALALFVAQAIGMYLLVNASERERLSQLSGIAAARIIGAADRGIERPNGSVRDGRPARAYRHRPDAAMHRAGGRAWLRVTVENRAPANLAVDGWPELSDRIGEILATSPYRFDEVRSITVERAAPAADPGARPLRLTVIGARTPDGRWIVVRGGAPSQRWLIPGLLAVQTLLLYLLLLGPILWIGWRVSRPLKRLSGAVAEPVGLAHPVPVVASGPGDIRDLIGGFNDMRAKIAAMLSDKDRMLGAIGHDLRTPLASLRVRVESVGDDVLRDRMIASIEAITVMLDDILSLARVGRSQETPAKTDMVSLVDALVEDYRDMGRDVGMAGGEGAVRTIRADLLRRAIRNLVDNALKYGTRARLSVEADGAGIAIVVRDDGPGIAADRIAELMEPFARDESSRNRDTGGAGLGLAIARAIVAHEGGRLVLANAADGGLEARIVLP